MESAHQRGAEEGEEPGQRPEGEVDDSKNNNFGMREKEKDVWDKRLNTWVRISHIGNGRTMAGLLINVDREMGYATLNPHQSGDYDKRGVFIKKIYDEPFYIPMLPLPYIGPASKEGIENMCSTDNMEAERNYKNSQEEEALKQLEFQARRKALEKEPEIDGQS